MDRISTPMIPALTGSNYHLWAMKIEAALCLRGLLEVLEEEEPTEELKLKEWRKRNNEATAYMKLSLSDEQALQYANEKNAQNLWKKIKENFTGTLEDRKIDASQELKNLELVDKEKINDYIARARGLSTKCASLGLEISPRELVYYTVRGLRGKFSRIRETLKTQREKSMDDVLEILREEERELFRNQSKNVDGAYFTRNEYHKTEKTCYICNKKGHLARNCYFKRNINSSKVKGEKTRKFEPREFEKRTANYASQSGSKQPARCAFNASVKDSKGNNSNAWILDSGATCHMSNNLKWFSEINFNSSEILQAGKNDTLNTEGIGFVKAKVYDHSKYIPVTMENVIYVPELRNNLISVTTLMDKGYKFKTIHDKLYILDNSDKILLTAVKRNKRLEIVMQPDVDTVIEVSNQVQCENLDSSILWHKRLCHLNSGYINKMLNENMTKSDDMKVNLNLECDSCNISKITRKQHKVIDVNQSNNVLELIHVDVCGPMHVPSLSGSKYFLVIVDDFSGMYFTYFVKHKNDVLGKFICFKEKYENILNSKIKRVRSDNGGEFVNEGFNQFFVQSGIIHEKTVPYNPESNGKAERANRVIIERARTLIYDSGLPLNFWAEAVACSTHVSNVTYRKGKGKTPYELWWGHKPNINYLRIFGCLVYFHVPKQSRNKLQVPGKRGIMLGYSNERRAYRIYDIRSQKVIEERSVKFIEHAMGSKFLEYSNENSWKIEKLFSDETIDEINSNSDLGPSIIDLNEIDEHFDDIKSPNARQLGMTREINERNRLENENVIEPNLRRSERLKEKYRANLILTETPQSFQEANESENWPNWQNAMKEELNSLNKHNVFEIVERTQGMKVINSKWVYSIKENNGEKKCKARLVAAAFNQKKNKDYSESYSPVVNIESWRMLMAIAAKMNWDIKLYDVKTAYLYGDIDETVYISIPPGFEHQFGEGKVCKLNRSIYGLPQSGRNWYLKLKSELINIGFKQTASDNCIFMLNDGNFFVIICVYVDDLAVFSNSEKLRSEIILKLNEIFELKDTTQNGKYLGIDITHLENGIGLSQTEYIESILQKHGMEQCKSVKTPISKGEDKSFEATDNLVDKTKYRELVGELLYLSNRTRPDLAFVMCYLSQFNERPEKRHFLLLKRVLRYLQGSKDKVLFYDNNMGNMHASADASWGNADGGKSFSGGVIMIGSSLVMWKCNKQKCVGISTCEVELFAISEIAKHLTWTSNLLKELKCNNFVKEPIIIHSDNQSAIDWLNGSKSSNKTRHVNLKFYFVKGMIEDNVIKLEFVGTDKMIADFLTKALSYDKIIWSMKQINLI